MGHYPLAIERLRILLVLFPDDQRALSSLLLCIVTQEITEAELYLERAKQNGATIEPALLDIIKEKEMLKQIKNANTKTIDHNEQTNRTD